MAGCGDRSFSSRSESFFDPSGAFALTLEPEFDMLWRLPSCLHCCFQMIATLCFYLLFLPRGAHRPRYITCLQYLISRPPDALLDWLWPPYRIVCSGWLLARYPCALVWLGPTYQDLHLPGPTRTHTVPSMRYSGNGWEGWGRRTDCRCAAYYVPVRCLRRFGFVGLRTGMVDYCTVPGT
jgi:hypothetical protein